MCKCIIEEIVLFFVLIKIKLFILGCEFWKDIFIIEVEGGWNVWCFERVKEMNEYFFFCFYISWSEGENC